MIVSFAFTFAILGPQLPVFTILLAIFSAGFMTIAYFSFAKIRHFSEKEAGAQSKLTAQLADSVANIQTVKSFGRERYEISRFSRKNEAQRDASFGTMRAMLVRDIRFGTVLSVLAIATFIFLIGGHAWFGATLGALFMAVSYMNNIWGQLWQFNRILRNVNKSFGDAQEMTEILEAKVAVKDAENSRKLVVRGGEIDFAKITFWHADAKETDAIFANFDLRIPAGQKVGLVGRSGSGKTTLTKLLLRFSDVQEGAITIDGQNIREITQKSLHRSIAYVPQEPMLFHRTIRENIAYAKPDATDDEIREAARKANALDFIEKLADGFETMTGERGVKLSGGQRQRIAIARAILADAPILILDEATSALDTESERLIQDALKNLMAGRTSIVIAHRLSTVANLDRILVMENGKIAEDGTHVKLISRENSIYAKLWNQQTGAMDD
jgi:ATP-binding cassette subfamily B protein